MKLPEDYDSLQVTHNVPQLAPSTLGGTVL